MAPDFPTPGRNILVYRLGSLGDTILALPAFHVIRRALPRSPITILTNMPVQAKAAPLQSLLQNSGLVDNWLTYPVGLRRFGGLRCLRQQIRQGRFTLVVHLAAARGLLGSLRDYLFFRWCGIARITGLPLRRRDLVCEQDPSGWGEWEARRLLRRVSALGSLDWTGPEGWDLRLTETEQAEAQALLDRFGLRRRFLAASIGAKVEAKDWTEPNWLALLAKLAAQYPALPLVMIGAEDERARSERCLAMWRGPQANLCGMTSPRVSAAILQHAGLFLGHDSGPMHLAACMGTACVAIFAARTPPGQWFPRGAQHTILYRRTPCAGCQLDVCTEHHKQCLLSITVEEVFTAVNKHLAGSEGQAVIPSQ